MGTIVGEPRRPRQRTAPSTRDRLMLTELARGGPMGTRELVMSLRRHPAALVQRASRTSHLAGGLSVDQVYRALRRLREAGLVEQSAPYGPWVTTPRGRRLLDIG